MAAKPESSASAVKPSKSKRPRGSRSRRTLVLLLLLFCALGYFAPQIVSRTALRQQIIPALVPDYPGAIEISGASLDWLSPVVLDAVVFYDLSGEPLATIPTLHTEKRLLDLVLNRSDAGKIVLDSPQVRVVVRNGRSNLEAVVRPMLDAQSEPSSSRLAIVVNSGTVELFDEARRTAKVADLSLLVAKSFDPAMLMQFECAGVIDGAGAPGKLRIKSHFGSMVEDDAETIAVPSVKLHLDADRIRLDDWRVLIESLSPGTECAGTFDAEVEIEGAFDEPGQPGKWTCSGRVASPEFRFVRKELLGNPLNVREFALGGAVVYDAGRIRIDDLRIKSDLARLAADGTFEFPTPNGKVASPSAPSVVEIASAIARTANGRVDVSCELTKLADIFPEFVRVKEGTELTGGSLQASVSSEPKSTRRDWHGIFEARGLAAVADGRSVTWEQPVSLRIAAHDDANGPVIDAIDCKSDFITASGRGSLNDATVNLACDLDRLSTELARFIDLESSQLAGKLKFAATCKRREGARVDAVVRGSVEKLEFSLPGKRLWNEERLETELNAVANLSGNRIDSLEKATFSLRSAADKLTLSLLKPANAPAERTEFPMGIQFEGDLARWKSRMHPWLELDDWELQGQAQLSGRIVVSRRAVRWEDLNGRLAQLRAWGPGVYVSDPNVRIQSTGSWDRVAREFSIPRTTWASNTLSLRADQISFARTENGTRSVSGQIVFRGGLEELLAWVRDPNVPRENRLRGVVSGSAKIARSGGITEADGSLQLDEMTLLTAAPRGSNVGWSEAWREKQLHIACNARYGHEIDTLELSKFDVSSESLKLSMHGAVGGLTSRPSADITGEIAYDWKNLTARLRPWFGDDLQFTGAQKNQFAVRGPRQVAVLPGSATSRATELAIHPVSTEMQDAATSESSALVASAGFGWQSAKIYGLDVGPAELKAHFDGGSVNISPLELAVGDGSLKLAPQLQLYGESPRIVLPEGRTIDGVKLSPDVCRGWMKYVAPLMADATQAEGKLSLDLVAAEFPVADPRSGNATGTLVVEQAAVSPGSAARSLLQVVEQVRQILKRNSTAHYAPEPSTWVRMPPQNVEFRMAERRVHHRLLEFHVGDVVIRTEGSVGFDESIALTATVPILDEWVQNDRVLAGLKGQSLRIPIGGTLKRPQIDPNVVRNLTRQVGGSAAEGYLQDGVQRGLDRLFKPRR